MKVTFTFVLLFALVACQPARKADIALYSLADSVSSRDTVTGARKLSYAERDRQISQGNKMVSELINKYRKEGKQINSALDSRQYSRALRVFDKVHSVSHMRDEEWDVYLIPEDSFNAFVTGGTSIVIHQGLMKELSFDDEVAAVIAHEIAHVSANHVFERQAAMMAGLIGGSDSIKMNSVQAGYSHNDEVEADKIGVLYAALAGYDPMASSRIWHSMYKSEGNDGQFYQSHPMTSERIKLTKEFGQKARTYYIPGKINPDFQNILANNAFWQKQGEGYQPGEGGGVAAVAETLLNYYVEKQNAQKEASRQNQRIGMLKDIQSHMRIADGKLLDNGQVAMLVQYTGERPVGKLAIKAVSKDKSSLYRHPSVVYPNQQFKALFDDGILKTQDGSKPQIKLLVDEGQYF